MTPADAQQIANAFPLVWDGVKRLGIAIDGLNWTVPDAETVCDVDKPPPEAKAWTTVIVDPGKAGHALALMCRQLAVHAVHRKGLVFYRPKLDGHMLSVDTAAPGLPCRVQLLGPLRDTARVTVWTRA